MNIAIAGAGLTGLLLAYKLTKAGYKITIFEKGLLNTKSSCAFVAAGMISPLAEAITGEKQIYQLGLQSIELWKQWLADLHAEHTFDQKGSIVVAHQQDSAELRLLAQQLDAIAQAREIESLDNSSILSLEPELTNFTKGLYLKTDGQIDNRALIQLLIDYLTEHYVNWQLDIPVIQTTANTIHTSTDKLQFDWVYDCRGIGAKKQLANLRGVRGEVAWIRASDVCLTRPVRLMHPRYQLYIVPKPNHIYAIGATSIESNDSKKVSVRSALELLSAAYSLHPGFAEAEILELQVGVRPAFSNNLPQVTHTQGHTTINGLYRHGFLIAPAVVQQALELR